MNSIRLILQIMALFCFLLATLEIHAKRGNLLAAGLFLWLLSEIMR